MSDTGAQVLASYSIKGGVGKTTLAVNLAAEAARTGVRVLLWDLDPQGAATFALRTKAKVSGGAKALVSADGELAPHIRGTDIAGVDVVPADFSLRLLDVHLDERRHPRRRLAALLEPIAALYDLVLLDCPAGISLASESIIAAADALVVPTIPSALSARTLEQLAGFLEGLDAPPDVWPCWSMVDRRRTLQRRSIAELVLQWPDALATAIPMSSDVERMGAERAPVGSYAPRVQATQAFRALWAEIAQRLWT